MDKYTNSIITSSFKYLQNLQYLAKEDNQTNIDLFDLTIINQVYQWACWFEVSEEDKQELKKLSFCEGDGGFISYKYGSC